MQSIRIQCEIRILLSKPERTHWQLNPLFRWHLSLMRLRLCGFGQKQVYGFHMQKKKILLAHLKVLFVRTPALAHWCTKRIALEYNDGDRESESCLRLLFKAQNIGWLLWSVGQPKRRTLNCICLFN